MSFLPCSVPIVEDRITLTPTSPPPPSFLWLSRAEPSFVKKSSLGSELEKESIVSELTM